MSNEIDTELRDLLIDSLKLNGSLPKIKSLLRASIFLALKDDEKLNPKPLLNEKVKSCLDTVSGQLLFGLVREFLEFLNLDLTLSVYDEETYKGTYHDPDNRAKLSEKLSLNNENSVPLLLQIFDVAQKFNTSLVSEDSILHDKPDRTASEKNLTFTLADEAPVVRIEKKSPPKKNLNSDFPPLRSPILPPMYGKGKIGKSDDFVEADNSYEEDFSSEIELDLSYSRSDSTNQNDEIDPGKAAKSPKGLIDEKMTRFPAGKGKINGNTLRA